MLNAPLDTLYNGYNGKKDFTGFDFQHYSSIDYLIKISQVDCNNAGYEKYCRANNTYYNPKQEPYISLLTVSDYQTVSQPIYVCEKGKAILPGNSHEENCSEYKCNGYESFEMKINANNKEITVICNKQNAGNESFYEQTYI